MTETLCTIIIPTYNRLQQLGNLLFSLREFGYLNKYEVIVVDNSSQPCQETKKLTDQYNVRYLSETKHGRSAALNAGIRDCSGKYVIFLDDDTQLDNHHWLDALVAHLHDHKVGYVSGNVIAFSTGTKAQLHWEEKGGLSKGPISKYYDFSWFTKSRLFGVPIRKIAVGANSIIPRNILLSVGLFDEMLGPGAVIPHGESLDICYRILRSGYTAIYEPKAIVKHHHPTDFRELNHKMIIYGIGDTAVHMKFFFEFHDFRSLREAICGRSLLLVKRLLLSLFGKYPLQPSLMIASLIGATYGPFLYIWTRFSTRSFIRPNRGST